MTSTPSPAPSPSTPPRATPTLDRFFGALHRSPVTRSADRVVAGVAGGVAERLGVSRAIVRVGFVLLALLGPGVLLYLLAWLMLPDSQGRVRLEGAIRGGEGGSVVLLVITALSFFGELFGGVGDRWDGPMMGPGMHGHGTGIVPLLVVVGIALIGWKKGWFTRHGHAPSGGQVPPASPPPPAPSAPQAPLAPQGPQGPQDAPRV